MFDLLVEAVFIFGKQIFFSVDCFRLFLRVVDFHADCYCNSNNNYHNDNAYDVFHAYLPLYFFISYLPTKISSDTL